MNRFHAGTIVLEDDTGQVVLGPYACRGKADTGDAEGHGNPACYPTLPFGDFPLGLFRITEIEHNKYPEHSYGPYFFRLDPLNGEALDAKHNGRVGLGVHGGDLSQSGGLRSTDGCLRVSNAAAVLFAGRLKVGDEFFCEEMP